MTEKRVSRIRAGPVPKSLRPAHKQGRQTPPILHQHNERELVVVRQQLLVESVQLFPDQMMQRQTGMLRGALNEPVKRKPPLNLKSLVGHAFGGGVGRVSGQSGLKGSSSGFGSGGGDDGCFGVGSGWAGLIGGATGSGCGIETSLSGKPLLPSKECQRKLMVSLLA